MGTQSSELVLSAAANLLAAKASPEGGVILHTAPRWLGGVMGWSTEFPLRSARGEWAPFTGIVGDLLENQLPVRDLVLELRPPSGELVSILVQGRMVQSLAELLPGCPAEPGALLALRDVSELVRERRRVAAIGTFHGLVGRSIPMLEVYQRIATYGPTEAPVIITGETGTGKELVARALHERSARNGGPFVAVNCVALTAELFESELFGHEKGSFTGAIRQHKGRFQRADGGTLFLDEIGDMPISTQAKMLRALEEGIVERIGSEKEERVDVRVVAATNVALEQAVALRRFRIDLFHRLSVLRIHVPALRDREGDLPLLAEHYLASFNRRYNRSIQRITPEALRVLQEYHWPGNVRELRNVIERLVIETTGEAITARSLAAWVEERDYMQPGHWNADAAESRPHEPIVTPAADSFAGAPRFGDAFWGRPESGGPRPRQIEWPAPPTIVEAAILPTHGDTAPEPPPAELTSDSIREAFRVERGNLTGAARRLGVHKATLYRHMERLGLRREDLEEAHSQPRQGT